jgi:hypothetical protein
MIQTKEAQAPTFINGVNVTKIFEMVDASKAEPKHATFQFRTSNQ